LYYAAAGWICLLLKEKPIAQIQHGRNPTYLKDYRKHDNPFAVDVNWRSHVCLGLRTGAKIASNPRFAAFNLALQG
jgi:hypothetical protein